MPAKKKRKPRKITHPDTPRVSKAGKVTRVKRTRETTEAHTALKRVPRKKREIPVIEEVKLVNSFAVEDHTVAGQLLEKDKRELRQAEVARLHLQERLTAVQISKKLGVNPKSIRRDLDTLRATWKEKREDLILALTDEELQKLDMIERELWLSWYASKKLSTDGVQGNLGIMKHLLSVVAERRKIISSERETEEKTKASGAAPVNWIGVIIRSQEKEGRPADSSEVIDVN